METQRSGFESSTDNDSFLVQTVEILRRPGQTLGFYIREGNGVDRFDGVFISRIAAGSVVDSNDLLRVMDEILAVDKIDVQYMSLDDVAILMSIPKRLVLMIRRTQKSSCPKNVSCPSLSTYEAEMSSALLRSTAPHQLPHALPHHPQQHQQPNHQPVYVRKGRVASVGDVTDNDDFRSSAGVHFRSGGTVNPGFRLSMETARSLSLRGQGSLGTPSGGCIAQNRQDADRRLKDSFPRTRERAVDILDELIGQQQQRQWRRSQRWQDNRKSSADSTRTGSSIRRRVDYSSDSDAQFGPDRTRLDQRGSADRLSSESALYNGHAFANEAILDRSGLISSCQRSLSKPRENSPERYSSDSEVGLTSGRGTNDKSPFARHSSYINRLLGPIDRCFTLPQKLQTAVNSDELKHWLQKLDNLAVELEGQHLASSSGSSVNTNAGSTDSMPIPTGRRCRTLSASSETECYTAQEYRSWIGRQSPSTSVDLLPPASSATGTTLSASRTSRQTNAARKLSADSLLDYRTYQTTSDSVKEPSIESQQTLQRRLLAPSSSTWKSHRSLSTSSSSSNTSLAVANPRSRQSTPSPSPGGTLDPTSFPPGPSKPLADRLAASSILKDLQAAKKPIQLRTEDFVLYAGTSAGPEDIGSSTSSRRTLDLNPFDGSIYVHIFCGHGLKASRTMLRDLYCVIAVDSVNKARTMIRTGAINFDWDEDFELDVYSAHRISFLIYSWDPTTKHQLCFSAALSIQTFLRHRQTQRRLALRLDPKGILYVELLCRDPGRVFQRLPGTDQSRIFGVALELIVRREASGDNIPVVLRRCVEEIERRGLNHVGLYRLCGSSKRNQQLKTDFESDALGVDLSPQAVSDINVITGVLKDFLQQLPEPIFTTGLYQMLLDAISVRIPEDPDGSSKLMFSVIDCLPKINQDVVGFLMTHLKRVVRKSDTNKMDSLSLAMIFGPLTLCPPYQTSTSTKEADFKKQAEVLRYIIEIWPDEKDGVMSRSPTRAPDGSSSSSLLQPSETQKPHESNPGRPTSADCNRTTTTALVHTTPPKTSFC